MSLSLAGKRALLLNHPDYIDHVLVGNYRNFVKHTFFWRHVEATFGKGLLTSEGDFWRRERKLAAPAFHRERVSAYGEVMAEYTERMLRTWGNAEIRDVHHEMMALTLQIVAKTLLGADVKDEVSDLGAAVDSATEEIAVRFRRPIRIPDLIPIPSNLRYRKALKRTDATIYRIIRERRESGKRGDDLLSLLLNARYEDGTVMGEQQLRDEAITLFLAGHETTAMTLTWTLYLLSKHPDVEEKLVSELEAVLRGRSPTVDDLKRLPYTESVIKESMRFYPAVYVIGREAVDDCEIGGYAVPARTTLFMSQWVMHRDPRYFTHPDVFNPGRWENGLEKRLPKFAYFPFGGGPRVCIGNTFAMMEAALLLAAIAQQYRLTLAPEQRVELNPSITLRPKHGMRMVLHKRLPS